MSGDGAAEDLKTRLRDAKLAAMAEFCAGAGHEINNPAAAIHGRCSLLLKKCDDPALERELRVISEQALRIRDMIADALLFARPPVPRKEPVWLD
ncbi:MAG: histidine kinase dimerization/phospho-acceptor domain-containing protein, partial [Planctomycetota bacterium]